jgi:hypothetical protein
MSRPWNVEEVDSKAEAEAMRSATASPVSVQEQSEAPHWKAFREARAKMKAAKEAYQQAMRNCELAAGRAISAERNAG